MAKCLKCGKETNASEGVCSTCRADVKYHYVERKAPKKVRRGKRLRSWMGSLSHEDKRWKTRHVVIFVLAAAVLFTALFLLRPKPPADEAGSVSGNVETEGN